MIMLILQIWFESRQLANNNIHFIPEDQLLNSNVEKDLITFKTWGRIAENRKPNLHGFAWITNNLDFHFLDLLLMVCYLLFLKTGKVQDEESKTINFGLNKSPKARI